MPHRQQHHQRHDHDRRQARIDAELHVAIAHQVGGREQERRPGHRIARTPARAGADRSAAPASAGPPCRPPGDRFADCLQAGRVVAGQAVEAQSTPRRRWRPARRSPTDRSAAETRWSAHRRCRRTRRAAWRAIHHDCSRSLKKLAVGTDHQLWQELAGQNGPHRDERFARRSSGFPAARVRTSADKADRP